MHYFLDIRVPKCRDIDNRVSCR